MAPNYKAVSPNQQRILDQVGTENRFKALESRLKALETAEPVKGERGDTGAPGAPGRDGKDAAPARDGKDGKDSQVIGPAGRNGAHGTNGKDGVCVCKQGVDGRDGAPGKDAAPAKDGKDGAIGPQGAHGRHAVDGKQGVKGDRGSRGEKGDRGERGEQGVKGDTGVQGERGDVFIPNETELQIAVIILRRRLMEQRAAHLALLIQNIADNPADGNGWQRNVRMHLQSIKRDIEKLFAEQDQIARKEAAEHEHERFKALRAASALAVLKMKEGRKL